MSRGLVGIGMIVVFVAVAGMLVLGVATGPVAAATPADNASLGSDISSFMQASRVETADDVEEGRFEAAMNRTDDPDERRALIQARQARLEERSERLSSQRETPGETPDVRNRSVATRISVGAAGLERSVNATERRAQAADVPTERLSELRENARTIRGPDVAELARGVGPPQNAGPPDGSSAENRPGPPGVRDDRQPLPESPGPPSETDAPTDARDAERGGPPGDGGASSSGPSDGESSDADPANADTPGADRADGSDANGAESGAVDGRSGDGGPPADDRSPGAPESDGSRPTPAGGTDGPPRDRGP